MGQSALWNMRVILRFRDLLRTSDWRFRPQLDESEPTVSLEVIACGIVGMAKCTNTAINTDFVNPSGGLEVENNSRTFLVHL